MASQTRTYEQKKLLGQIYTPRHIVTKILHDTGFYEADLTNKTILDPACGDGRFLVPVAEHIIQNGDPETVTTQLRNIYGWDIDKNALAECRKNLDAIIEPLGISVKWNLIHRNALAPLKRRKTFDFIVGNPPYIRIQHLEITQRNFIQKHYSFCKNGSTDAYIAFFQLASTLLNADGICGLITPNGYLTSETGRPLRSYFKENANLFRLTNYASVPVFANTATYSAITIFGKKRQDAFQFEQCRKTAYDVETRHIAFAELDDNRPWQLSVKLSEHIEGIRLGDLCRISVGITTLADPLFLFTIIGEKNNLFLAKSKQGIEIYLEKEILKPIIKASKIKHSDEPANEHILFPYQKDETGKQRIIPENVMRRQFPHTFSYLLQVKPALDRRDNGKANAVAWYAFGRAQGLDTSFGEKIVFSPMNLMPNFVYYQNPETTVYSGYFIKYDGDYQALLTQLNSTRMAEFIAVAGRDFQGGYKGYNKKIVENFIITLPV